MKRLPTVASLGPNVLLPLFDGRRLTFNQDAAMARMTQALVSYRKTILGALGEVANGLTAYDTSTELVGIQRQRVAIAREAMRLAELRFRAGAVNANQRLMVGKAAMLLRLVMGKADQQLL